MKYNVNEFGRGDIAIVSFDPGDHEFPAIEPKLSGKRCLDLSLAIIGLVLLSPLIVGLIILMKINMPGSLFYGHKRIGRNGKSFKCWKFRTMVENGDELLKAHLATCSEAYREWSETRKLTNDPRVTPLGAVFRKLSLDEIPQLFNVLSGDMSLVGPRPVVSDELERYGASSRHYLSVRPGVTGLWQISGRSETTYQRRVAFDRYYALNRSLMLDVRIILATLPAVIMSRGAC